jgi:predicted regulator of Ras-like GTPase activity (Roadblock/LC7/MglB family)
MSLKQILASIVDDVSGGLGAIIIGYDGISVDEYMKETPLDIHTMAIEYVTVIREIRNTVSVLGIGNMEELAIHTENLQAVMRAINEDLLIVLVMTSDGNYGKGRYLLKRDVPLLREALA